MKYYAVKVGKKPGIYHTWEECKEQVNGVNGAIYKSFTSLSEAENFLNDQEEEIILDMPTCYIDGSYDAKSEAYSFGGVLLLETEKITFKKAFAKDEYSQYRNVAGEIKGAAYIMNYAIKRGLKKLRICYDYMGIEKWYTGSWKANSKIALEYLNFADAIRGKLEVEFVKIKSHTNNKYNDLADSLAKEALEIK